jgi:hypothetical protein
METTYLQLMAPKNVSAFTAETQADVIMLLIQRKKFHLLLPPPLLIQLFNSTPCTSSYSFQSFILQWLCNLFLDPGHFFSSVIFFTQTLGLLGRGKFLRGFTIGGSSRRAQLRK